MPFDLRESLRRVSVEEQASIKPEAGPATRGGEGIYFVAMQGDQMAWWEGGRIRVEPRDVFFSKRVEFIEWAPGASKGPMETAGSIAVAASLSSSVRIVALSSLLPGLSHEDRGTVLKWVRDLERGAEPKVPSPS